MMPSVIYHPEEINFSIQSVPDRAEPDNVLLCTPEYFDIVDEKNVHMQGQIGQTNKELALSQWSDLKNNYQTLQENEVLKEVSVISGAPDCEDMVFCANQSFPWTLPDGSKVVVMSKMRHASRQREVIHFEDFFRNKGFNPLHFTSDLSFEGMGDVIPHPGKQLLYGGYGYRTMKEVYSELARLLQTPVIALELTNSKFYHLDTCFVPLSSSSVMICREAFTDEGIDMIKQMFSTVHTIPEQEASDFFSLNAHVLNLKGNKSALLHKGSVVTKKVLEEEGFDITELDTSEFMKSGGSVFCMKMMY